MFPFVSRLTGREHRGCFAVHHFCSPPETGEQHLEEGQSTWFKETLSTCSVTARLAFILNLSIHFGFPGMSVFTHLEKAPAIPRHSGIGSQITRHRGSRSSSDRSCKVLLRWRLHLDFTVCEHNLDTFHRCQDQGFSGFFWYANPSEAKRSSRPSNDFYPSLLMMWEESNKRLEF